VPGPTPHYPPEFKREAIELYRSSEKSIPKVAQDLGASPASPSGGGSGSTRSTDEGKREGLTTDEREELSKSSDERSGSSSRKERF
jgi:transposase